MSDYPCNSEHYLAQGQAIAQVLLCHGAGAGKSHTTMVAIAQSLQQQGFDVISYNFEYMVTIEQTGRRRPPPKLPLLVAELAKIIDALPTGLPLLLAGKSMGARVAISQLSETALNALSHQPIAALAYGYPFLPPRSKQAPRLTPLQQAIRPVLVHQGERDGFGNRASVAQWDLATTQLHWLNSADHDLTPLKRSGYTQQSLLEEAALRTKQFLIDTLKERCKP
ncbi:alpha/beta family hydrolase [Paraferrimonas haliotis]|uniref:Alpha/beta hydrolase n=1 Tax=Paraferrimonas haliotis TaxID=2013866 RepID=A0AA37TQS3_9GAMM|nr:alpha/beta family hydrolase [Paraferrimonas haliotis]GLS82966.1 alpha/beta hydrolase [Paraferrimonas haliotis]